MGRVISSATPCPPLTRRPCWCERPGGSHRRLPLQPRLVRLCCVPELPEAETVRRQLEPQIVGRRITQSWARLPRITRPSIDEFVELTQGCCIEGALRRGKQIYFPLDNEHYLM